MRVNILGFGITNKALVGLLNHYGISCDIFDDRFENQSVDSKGNVLAPFKMAKPSCALSLISPGIPPDNPHLKKFAHIICEYDFIYYLLDRDHSVYSVWISGTNGKTTSTQMTSLMLNARSGGNIGVPLADLFLSEFGASYDKDRFISKLSDIYQSSARLSAPFNIDPEAKIKWALETSSFSLHYARYALPNLYILLPIRQDHIDWHKGYDNYIYDKIKILDIMPSRAHFALIPHELLGALRDIGSQTSAKALDIIDNFKGNIYLYKDSKNLSKDFNIDYANFKEPFLLDFMLSACGMKFAGLDFDIESIKNYSVDNYRIKEKRLKDILFINDSKATNPHACIAALRNYAHDRIYLILGGDSKGADLTELYVELSKFNVSVFSIGADGERIYESCLKYGAQAKYCKTLREGMLEIKAALDKDKLYRNPKDSNQRSVIMLSPACASLDQYKSYKHRGDEFDALSAQIFG